MSDDSQLMPGDAGWAEDKVLLADLSRLNTAIARYVLRQLDIDAQQAEPVPVSEEQAFGQELVELGDRIQRRAAGQSAANGSRAATLGEALFTAGEPPVAPAPS